jgi:hypothetical protein
MTFPSFERFTKIDGKVVEISEVVTGSPVSQWSCTPHGVTLIRANSQHHCLRLLSISKIAENAIFDPEKQTPRGPIIPMRVSQGSVLERRKKEGKIGAEARSAGMFVYVASTTS